jgi:hypothetical protein
MDIPSESMAVGAYVNTTNGDFIVRNLKHVAYPYLE